MIIYILTFAISCLLTFIAEKYIIKNKKVFVLLSLMAILLPSIIAGVRDFTIGYDVQLYGVNQFQLAVYSDSFGEYRQTLNTDIGYAALNYLVSRFTDNANWFLFWHEFIIVLLVYLFAYGRREKHPMWLTMLAFFTIFYNATFNLLRQSLAIAITIFGMKYAEDRKLLKFILTIIIACMFHMTSIIVLPVYFLFGLEKSKKKIIYKTFLLLLIVFILPNFLGLVEGLVNMGLLSTRFLAYVDVYSQVETDFAYLDSLFRLAIIFVCIITYRSKIQFDSKNATYIYMLIIDFILLQLTLFFENAQRLSFYYGFPALFYMIPQLSVGFKNNKQTRWVIILLTVLLLMIFWYIKYVYFRTSLTYPYTSTILGI